MQDPPERPRAHNQTDSLNDNSQLWNLSNETCPEKTVPIKRTTKEDILRSYYINRFGKKLNSVKRNTIGIGHVVSNHKSIFFSFHFNEKKLSLNTYFCNYFFLLLQET
jgi:hypothetical protein